MGGFSLILIYIGLDAREMDNENSEEDLVIIRNWMISLFII